LFVIACDDLSGIGWFVARKTCSLAQIIFMQAGVVGLAPGFTSHWITPWLLKGLSSCASRIRA
jgi:hypothetical protein